mgnify:CR=1 FL=1
MSLSLHTLKSAHGARKKTRRIGRGYGSGRAKTSGRGTKGQRARTGGRNRLKQKGIRAMLLGFPKQRGFTSHFVETHAIRIGRIMESFNAGEQVDLQQLKKKQLVPSRAISVKLVGGGLVNKKLQFVGLKATAAVKVAVEKAGGSWANAKI